MAEGVACAIPLKWNVLSADSGLIIYRTYRSIRKILTGDKLSGSEQFVSQRKLSFLTSLKNLAG